MPGRTAALLASLLAALAAPLPASAWDDHATATRAALGALPELATAPAVSPEPLERFVAAEAPGLAALLDGEERWARAAVPSWPALPPGLRFDPTGDPATLRLRLLEALRVNPTLPCAVPPGAAPLPALDVVAAASDEPDQGLDLGLWEDSGTAYGARFGLGKLPFGNPTLSFATQAPFHMGFFHESAALTRLAPALLRTYPEVRLHAFASLARFAFARGHAYWGWRFLGWGLHYAQDLTQPWHATVSPGTGTATLIAVSLLDLVGVHGPRADRLQLLTNRHLLLEQYQGEAVRRATRRGDPADPLLAALRDPAAEAAVAPLDDAFLRRRVSARAHAGAARADAALVASLPARWVDDPRHKVGAAGVVTDVWGELDRAPPSRHAPLAEVVADLMRDLGGASRVYARGVLAAPGPRR